LIHPQICQKTLILLRKNGIIDVYFFIEFNTLMRKKPDKKIHGYLIFENKAQGYPRLAKLSKFGVCY